MFPAPIREYHRPSSIAEALSVIAREDVGEAIFLAGGQSAMQAIKSRMLQPDCIIDLQAVDAIRGIRQADGALEIGAMTRYVDIAENVALDGPFAALRDAASHIGDRQVRNRGTIGGSLCWNYVAACMPTVVLGLGGVCHLVSLKGERSVPADDFFLGPLTTAREDGELLSAIRFAVPVKRSGSAYRKWGLVTDALPVVGVCVNVSLSGDGRCTAARVSLTGLPDGAQRSTSAEDALLNSDCAPEVLRSAMNAAADSVDAQSDGSASADYRRQLIRTLGAEVAQLAVDRAKR